MRIWLTLFALLLPSVAWGQLVAPQCGSRVLRPLEIATVTTGGVAVQAFNAGDRTAGGWIYNPSASQNLCINESGSGTAGTSSSGNTTCVPPGFTYFLAPNPGSVSVNSTDSSHAFSGWGWK